MKHIILSTFLIFLCINIKGQEQHGGTPLMFDKEKPWLQEEEVIINNITYDEIDNKKEQEKANEIAYKHGYGINKFYGIGVSVDIDLKKEATILSVGDVGNLYLLELTSPTAYALQVYFDAFKIPEDSRMFVYDKDKTRFIGSFTNRNNQKSNSFGTIPIPGNSIIIEYYEPNKVDFEPELHIKNLSHVFLPLPYFSNLEEYSESDKCQINVVCPLGNDWKKEKRSVALILTVQSFSYGHTYATYFGFCSGALINNTRQDGEPLFLTAKHCSGGENPYIWNWIFLFNFETTQCNQDGSNLLYNIPNQSIYGATELSSSNSILSGDYLLLKLNTTPATLKNYNAVWAGWESSEFNAQNSPYTVGIHHPTGDVKKIAKDNHSPLSYDNQAMSRDCERLPSPRTTYIDLPFYYYWQVRWDQGITAPGSSGSPLFNSNKKIIGHLNGGCSYCDYSNYPDYYSKFSHIYGQIHTYLDPVPTFATSLSSFEFPAHCTNGIQDGNETNVDCGGSCPPCVEHCFNWIQDGNETDVDCGGSCPPCIIEHCFNGVWDSGEQGVDCGGDCPPCLDGCGFRLSKFSIGSYPIVVGYPIGIGAEISYLPSNSVGKKVKWEIKVNKFPNDTRHNYLCEEEDYIYCETGYSDIFQANSTLFLARYSFTADNIIAKAKGYYWVTLKISTEIDNYECEFEKPVLIYIVDHKSPCIDIDVETLEVRRKYALGEEVWIREKIINFVDDIISTNNSSGYSGIDENYKSCYGYPGYQTFPGNICCFTHVPRNTGVGRLAWLVNDDVVELNEYTTVEKYAYLVPGYYYKQMDFRSFTLNTPGVNTITLKVQGGGYSKWDIVTTTYPYNAFPRTTSSFCYTDCYHEDDESYNIFKHPTNHHSDVSTNFIVADCDGYKIINNSDDPLILLNPPVPSVIREIGAGTIVIKNVELKDNIFDVEAYKSIIIKPNTVIKGNNGSFVARISTFCSEHTNTSNAPNHAPGKPNADSESEDDVFYNASNSENSIFVYPNPTTGIVNIEVFGNMAIQSISVFDVLGKTLQNNIAFVGNTLDLSYLSNGIYFIKIQTLSGQTTHKVIIQK